MSKPEKSSKKKDTIEDLSPKDQLLKIKIDSLAETICNLENNESETLQSLRELTSEVQKSTKLRTAIPKAMKFLKPHYPKLEEAFDMLIEGSIRKKHLADFLSLVCNSLKENYDRNCLKYLQIGTGDLNLESMGEEYVLALSGDLANEYLSRLEEGDDTDDLFELANKILPFMFKSGNEINALDLLLELEQLGMLTQYISSHNFLRIFNYLIATINFSADNVEYEAIMKCLFTISMEMKNWTSALRVAIRANSKEMILQVVGKTQDKVLRKQFCFMLGRHR